MPLERRQKLEALNFEWDLLAVAWEEGFSALEQFKAREGHCRVPARHLEANYRLGKWVQIQRGQRNGMSVERRSRLETLDFDWDRFTSAWEAGFAALLKFHEREQHCHVPREYLEGSYRLGQWVREQRKWRDTMSVERRQRLDALGFEWDLMTLAWEEGFAALEQFKARNGHCRVPKRHIEGTYRLGGWVGTQRGQKDSMPIERRQRLDDLGFEWDTLAVAWNEGFAALNKFKEREGHCRVSNRHVEGTYRLGQWVGYQRKRKNILPVERRRQLEALGFEWDPFTTYWKEGFAALQKFHAREHHCRVPSLHLEGTHGLGQWASKQRTEKNTMPVERRLRLEALGFEWEILESAWEDGFAALQRFHTRERHCRVPASHNEGTYKLGQWVGNQRRLKHTMPIERRQKLETLGFEWEPFASDWQEGFAALERFKAREGHCRVPKSHIEDNYKLG